MASWGQADERARPFKFALLALVGMLGGFVADAVAQANGQPPEE